MNLSQILAVIPARAGSKGIPGKNTKILAGKPLFVHSLEFARLFLPDNQICISTDDPKLLEIAHEYGYQAPFVRPAQLSEDTSTTFEVLHHVQSIYQKKESSFQGIWLLQPTSPFRLKEHGKGFLNKVVHESSATHVSVVPMKHHPWFNLFREESGRLVKFMESPSANRRQDCPPAVALNGSMYWFPWADLAAASSLSDFPDIRSYTMGDLFATDLDVPRDWAYAEWLLEKYQSEMRDW